MIGIKLNELPYDGEFLNALGELEMRIIEDYEAFMNNEDMRAKFKDNINYMPGQKYLKIVTENSVWGFIKLNKAIG